MDSEVQTLGKTFFERSISQYVRRQNLSEREKEVFTLLLSGATSSEKIASLLGVSRNTIRNHFQNIFYKTRTSSKTELLVQFVGNVFGECVAEEPEPGAQAIHILYVEDDPAFSDLATRALKRANSGGSVSVVRTGREAMAYLRREGKYGGEGWRRPSVILLDLVLPDRDGLEVLDDIKREDGYEAVPVVALTMKDDPETTKSLYQRGGSSLIQKPVGFRALVDLMRTISTYWIDAARLPGPA